MSHPFGDLLGQHLHRKHGLSQARLAEGIQQAPTVVSAMCKGKRLTGPRVRERIVAMIGWLHGQGVLDTFDEANALLHAAGMSPLSRDTTGEAAVVQLLRLLRSSTDLRQAQAKSPAKRSHNHNLPAPATALIGRSEDVALARARLGNDDVRLITFLGPPGVGKTRLALQVAWQARDDPSPDSGQVFADGAWFVSLAAVSDPHLIASTIVQALGLPSFGAQPLALLMAHLRDKQLLLILDNVEQLLSPELDTGSQDGGSDAPMIVTELLAAAPRVKILVTSRIALHLSGEHWFEVQPLAEPSAIELFVQRAQASNPGFALSAGNAQTVAEICRRLDGLPLAIELAAARIRMFDLPGLLARLSSRLDVLTGGPHDLPARQRTLRNTIDWSYDLLSPGEQTLFRRLGVFADGCSLEAAARVAGDGLQSPVRDVLHALADKSLIKIESQSQDEHNRYTMLETMREYALDRLSANDETDALVRRHAEYFTAYAESIEAKLSGLLQVQLIWIRQLDRDGDNLRAALAYARRTGDTLLQLRFVAALWPWLFRKPDAEGWAWLSALLSRRTRQPRLLRARALMAAAEILKFGGDCQTARSMAEEGTRLFKNLGETLSYARSLARLAHVTWYQGDYAEASAYCEQSVTLFRQAGDDLAIADTLQWQAAIERDQGDFERSAELFEQCLSRFRSMNDAWNEGNIFNGMGDLAFSRGDYVSARVCYERARAIWGVEGLLIDFPLRGLGRIAYVQGDTSEANLMLETVVTNIRKWSNTAILRWCLHHLGFVKHLLGDEAGAAALLGEAIAIQHRQTHWLCVAESLERLAWVAADRQRLTQAVRLFGAADALRKRMGVILPLGDKPLYDRYLEMTRSALDGDDFGEAWAKGAAMSVDQSVAYALAQAL